MADVVNDDIVLLTPKERHSIERLAIAQDVSSRDLALTLGHDPLFDADSFPRVRVGPAGYIAGSEDARRAGFQILVDCNAAVNR